jgi:hypothetical protein
MIIRGGNGQKFYRCNVCGLETGIVETWTKHVVDGCRPPPGEGLSRRIR